MISERETLLDGLLPVLLPKGGYVVAMYHAFLDESGTDDGSDVMCVAGYLVRSDKARRMERAWNSMLAKYDLPFFHMADCACDPGFGEFAKLSKDQRIACVKDCIYMIKNHVEFGAAAIVNPKRYKEEALVGAPDAYTFCLHAVFRLLTVNPSTENSKVTLFFEQGHAFASTANRYFDEVELPPSYESRSFSKKGEVRLLEAADLLAWQATKHLRDKAFSNRKPRKDFVSLLDTRGHMFMYYDMANNAISGDYYPAKPNEQRDIFHKAYFTNDDAAIRAHQATLTRRVFLDEKPGPIDHKKASTWFDWRPPFMPTRPNRG